MAKALVEQVLHDINKIFDSYDKLHEYERTGCTTEQIKKELVMLKESTEKLSPLMTRLFKENPSQIKGISTLSSIFKITYLPTLKIHLLYISQIKESKTDLLKIQSRLAITYLNVDGCIDSLRIIHAYLK
ncbi:MAG: hypothetical protein KGI27_11435 [Thaumarchaeota archaeon]|nr:hypothetical protein [Nitrososphaerota archaeon]